MTQLDFIYAHPFITAYLLVSLGAALIVVAIGLLRERRRPPASNVRHVFKVADAGTNRRNTKMNHHFQQRGPDGSCRKTK